MVALKKDIGLSEESRASLEKQQTLADVVQWTIRAPETALIDIVVQDEYTHDVIVKHGEHWLVYDTT